MYCLMEFIDNYHSCEGVIANCLPVCEEHERLAAFIRMVMSRSIKDVEVR